MADTLSNLIRGNSDRLELFRDASNFEYGYSNLKDDFLIQQTDYMIEAIEDGMVEHIRLTKHAPGGGFAWLDEAQHDNLDILFKRLQSMKHKRVRGMMSTNRDILVENYQPKDEKQQEF